MNSIVWVVAMPLLGALVCTLLPRLANKIAWLFTLMTLVASLFVLYTVIQHGEFYYVIGGWVQGLGIALFADSLTALMLVMTASIALAVSVYSTVYFGDQHQQAFYWPLWLLLLTALNALFVSSDLFNLYVTLELLGLAAAALTAMGGSQAALSAALRYLLVGLIGSLAFLAGVTLAYAAYGSLDIAVISQQLQNNSISWVITSLVTLGLVIKAALFPMHFWLPAAHANAPAPISAVLSALVVKAAVYLLIRLWLDVFHPLGNIGISYVLGLLGAMAILWGSYQALRAQRLKLLAAYSTVAQIGYLILGLSLLLVLPPGEIHHLIIVAIVLMALTHAFAKSALFLAAGVIQQYAGHDRINDLDGTAQNLPVTTFTLALAGVALIGLPPSGAFIGKWQMLFGIVHEGLWLWVVVIIIGSLLSAAYVFRLLGHAFGKTRIPHSKIAIGREEIPALLLSLIATLVLMFASAPIAKWLLPLSGGMQ